MTNNHNFETLTQIIERRRTTKVAQMNGSKISRADMEAVLGLANWAPTHGRTEPWRFIVYEDKAFEQFCLDHAELYKSSVTSEQFLQEKYNNLIVPASKASHLVVAYMQRTPNTKIPLMEEEAAAIAAIQNVLLGVAAKNIAAIWNTGGMFFKPEMHTYLNLGAEDVLLGFLYFGYADEPLKEGTRKTDILEKITWHS